MGVCWSASWLLSVKANKILTRRDGLGVKITKLKKGVFRSEKGRLLAQKADRLRANGDGRLAGSDRVGGEVTTREGQVPYPTLSNAPLTSSHIPIHSCHEKKKRVTSRAPTTPQLHPFRSKVKAMTPVDPLRRWLVAGRRLG